MREAAIVRSMSSDEKRRFPRLPIFSAALITRDGQGWLSEVRDLSQGGACLARPARWSGNAPQPCRVYFIFDQETVVALDACCVRDGPEDLGFEFSAGQDSDVQTLLYESNFADRNIP